MQLSIFPEDEPPDEPGSDLDHAQIQRNGLAAEHLVCAHLLTEGYDAFLVATSRPYDVLVDTGGELFRLQIKSAAHQKPAGKHYPALYRFGHDTSGLQRGNGLQAYQNKVDAFAFVALDIRRIIYLHAPAVTTKSIYFSQRDFIAKETTSWNNLKSLLNP